jgi:hypothetical protein
MAFVEANPVDFLDSSENRNILDTAVLAHWIYYMSSPTVLLNTLRELYSTPSIKRVCVSEHALTASHPESSPHVLAVLI